MGIIDNSGQDSRKYALRIYTIIKNGPLDKCGANELTDFIIPPDEVFSNQMTFEDWVKTHSNQEIILSFYSLLTKKFEQHLSDTVILIPSRKRVNGKEYRTFISKKVPRDKTLTAVFDGYLDDILFPAIIVGKRVRYSVGKTRTYKVLVDPLDKEIIEYKIPAITACYKAITNRKLEVEFQK